jgi:hypothetical protein
MIHEATRDAVLMSQRGAGRYAARLDTGPFLNLIGQAYPGAVYAAGRTGHLALVVQTGQAAVRAGDQVRVRVLFARDTGDAAGTLAFDQDPTPGIAPRAMFA